MSSGSGRRTLRERKVSQRMAVVDESTRQQANEARLEALEADNDIGEDAMAGGSEDDDFLIAGDEDEEEEVEVSGKRKKKKQKGGMGAGPKRKLRVGAKGGERRAPKSFQRLLEEMMLDGLPPGTPNYLSAAVGPPRTHAQRKFCSVCGNLSSYTCARCGSRYCCRRCFATHTETRCLKFTA